MNVLGIETSCDETSAAVVRDGREILSNIIASQADLHALYGGVVPEAASRMHVERMLPVIQESLKSAELNFAGIDALAVTNRPGLLGALLVGVSAAKALAYTLSKPLIGVHHLEGHICSSFLTAPELEQSFPLLILVVSGGHTQLVRMNSHRDYRLLGQTLDDAAGEAFDKGARLLDLPYPGGPNLERLALEGDPKRVVFPRSMMGDESLDFSFSGVKTSLRNQILRHKGEASNADLAASYQAAIVGALTEKCRRAALAYGLKTLCVAGGVAANSALSKSLASMCSEIGVRLVVPPSLLCTDNAAMIAAAGYFRLRDGDRSGFDFDTYASETLSSAIPAE